jgi:two-component system, LytTR family, response regulator
MTANIIKAAIIDDESHCIKTLQYQIERLFKNVEIVFTTTDSTAAKALTDLHRPGIIFLDIEMPVMNGLQFLSQFETIPFKVIFTTAYDQYAIKAIRLNAVDYLLKPVNRDELELAIEKYIRDRDKTSKEQITQLHLFTEKKITGTIALSATQGLFFVKLKEIMYLEGDDCYTHVIMSDGKKYLVSKTLSVFDEILTGDHPFFRAHKSYIINLTYIKQYIRGDGGDIVMHDDKHIALSRNNKVEFLKLFTKV